MKMRWIMIIGLVGLAQVASGQGPQPVDCTQSGPHGSFDFWLGEWEVRDAAGQLQGRNSVRKVQKGCALEEQWTSVRGGTGQSVNLYHPGRNEWQQLWTDAGYSIIDIRGGLQGNDMVLEGSIFYLGEGTQHAFRGRWSPLEDGRVRQFFEQQDDDGNWQTWFEGFYQRLAQ